MNYEEDEVLYGAQKRVYKDGNKTITVKPWDSRAKMEMYMKSHDFPSDILKSLKERRIKLADATISGFAPMTRTTKVFESGQPKKIGVRTIDNQQIPPKSPFLVESLVLLWTGAGLADSNEKTVANAVYKPIYDVQTGAISASFTTGVMTLKNNRKEILNEFGLFSFAGKDEKTGLYGCHVLDNPRLFADQNSVDVELIFHNEVDIPANTHLFFAMKGTICVPA